MYMYVRISSIEPVRGTVGQQRIPGTVECGRNVHKNSTLQVC